MKQIIRTTRLEIEVEEVTEGGLLQTGMRCLWIEAEDEETGNMIELTSGAGCGSPWMTIVIERNGERTRFRADMRKFLNQFYLGKNSS